MRTFLIEGSPRDSTGATVVKRMAGGGSRAYTGHRGALDWRAGLAREPRFSSSIGFGVEGWTGGAIPQVGAIEFAPSDKGTLSEFAALNWIDAPVTLYTGDDATANPTWTVELVGKVAAQTVRGGRLVLTVADMSISLNVPVAAGRFAGTGGIEGPVEAAQRVKRRSFGFVANVEGRVLVPAYNVYEFGDPGIPLQSFLNLRDKGRSGPILAVIPWAGTIAATLAALNAYTFDPEAEGGGVVAPSIACVRWWTSPSGPLTADIQGEAGNDYADRAASLASKLSAVGGVAVSDIGTWNAARNFTVGLHVEDGSETAASALDRLLLPLSMTWVMTPTGAIQLRQFSFENPVETVTSIDRIERLETYPSIIARRLGYQRNHRQHSAAEISAAIQASDVIYSGEGGESETVQDLKPAMPGANKGALDGDTIGGVYNPATGVVEGGTPVEDVVAVTFDYPTFHQSFDDLKEEFEPIRDSIPGLVDDISALDLARISANTAIVALGKADIDHEAVQRRLERSRDEIAEVALRAIVDAERNRQVMSDAGITVDPTTGKVRIAAIDQVADRTSTVEIVADAAKALASTRVTYNDLNFAIASAVLDPSQIAELGFINGRLTDVEILADGNAQAITLKVDTIEFNGVEARVTDAEIEIDTLNEQIVLKVGQDTFDTLSEQVQYVSTVLSTLGNMTGITTEILQARRLFEDSRDNDLYNIIAREDADKRTFDLIGQFKQEAYVRMDDFARVEVTARMLLTAQLGALDARSVQERTVQATFNSALAQSIDALGVTNGQQSAAIGNLQTASIANGKGIASVETTIRQVVGNVEDNDDALLDGIIRNETAEQARRLQIAQFQTEFSTTLVANQQAAASAREALLVRIFGNEAAIVTTANVAADANRVTLNRTIALEGIVTDGVTGLPATRTRIASVEAAINTPTTGYAARIGTVEAVVLAPDGLLPVTKGRVDEIDEAISDPDTGYAKRIETVEGIVYDPVTGLEQTRSLVTDVAEALSNPTTGYARRIETVEVVSRQAALDVDDTGESLLDAIIGIEEADELRGAEIAQARTEFSTTLVTNQQAEAAARQVLFARILGNEAAIVTSANVAASANSVTAGRTTSLETVLYDGTTGLAATRVRVGTVESAITTPGQAIGSRVTNLDAEFRDVTTGLPATRTRLGTVETAITTPGQATGSRVTNLDTEFRDPATGLAATRARVGTIETAISDPTMGIARKLELLEAEIDGAGGDPGLKAVVSFLREAVVGPDGALARAVLEVKANGRIGALRLTNNGAEIASGFDADNFGIYDPVTGERLFFVDADGAIATRFKSSAISYDNMQLGSAQKVALYSTPSSVTIARGVTTQVVSMTFVKEDTDSILEILFCGDFSSADDLQFTGSIAIDATVIKSTNTNIILVAANAAMPITPFAYATGVAAGEHTVTFTVTNNESDNVGLTIAAGSTLKVVELRKASIGSSTGSGSVVITPPPPDPGEYPGDDGGSGGGGGGYNGHNPIP